MSLTINVLTYVQFTYKLIQFIALILIKHPVFFGGLGWGGGLGSSPTLWILYINILAYSVWATIIFESLFRKVFKSLIFVSVLSLSHCLSLALCKHQKYSWTYSGPVLNNILNGIFILNVSLVNFPKGIRSNSLKVF